jgi:NADPH-dependent 2,4-dienoyl-CoA reductase/sulfur reductase-like enzyme
MRERRCDVLVCGGGVAAALAASAHGLDVVVSEPTDWIGGQLTSRPRAAGRAGGARRDARAGGRGHAPVDGAGIERAWPHALDR